MSGKVVPCALCQAEAATVFCVNDDAHLCSGCDASVHSGNPLLARHERRPLAATAGECASAAHGPSPASTDCGDFAVVPQLCGAALTSAYAKAEPAVTSLAQPQFLEPLEQMQAAPVEAAAALPAPPSPAPLALYEDSFFGRSLTTNDLLDLDGDDLELPGVSGSGGAFACFDPLDDCVVPSFGAAASRFVPDSPSGHFVPQQSSFLQQPSSYMPPYFKQYSVAGQPGKLVPIGGSAPAVVAPKSAAAHMTDAEAEAVRVQRHRERQRKKRAFGRTVRYQSRRAYAEIRPRIKGRFVTPEEYAVYQVQQSGPGAADHEAMEGGEAEEAYAEEAYGEEAYGEAYEGPAVPSLSEEDAVVPVPTFVVA